MVCFPSPWTLSVVSPRRELKPVLRLLHLLLHRPLLLLRLTVAVVELVEPHLREVAGVRAEARAVVEDQEELELRMEEEPRLELEEEPEVQPVPQLPVSLFLAAPEAC